MTGNIRVKFVSRRAIRASQASSPLFLGVDVTFLPKVARDTPGVEKLPTLTASA